MKLVSVPRGEALIIEDIKNEFYIKKELIELLEVIRNDERYLFFSLLAFTGIRKGEAFALQ
ncbi:MAG: hypothetical protein ACI32O_01055 [Enterococcus sp.]|uniref:hypothetical protein n=1 Tax=Candidatus Enterococcus wittei TaxID=1987383 RepID=UPI001FCEDEF5|nr:hypothetical protein [Enterococcus sp. 10A9_DIV0425]